ncbi:zinc finger protein 667 isoform X10 [Dasypus novemcinctus]|uniref:zinc finger protein 667 isoform X10 n=1 Tax=Dasypus novemcinctus TaxID=9361 RepID=UPI0039C9E6BA
MVALVRVHCWPAGMASAPSSGQLVSRPDSPRPAQPATFGLSSIQSRAAGASGSPNRSSKRAGTGVRISLRRGARPQELLTMGVKGESVGARSPQREHADWAVPQKKRKFNPDSLIPGLPSLCNHTSFPSDLAHSAEFLGENYFVDKKHAFQIWHVWLDAISSEKLKDEHNTASRSNQFYLRNQKGKAKWFTYLCRLVPSVEPQGGGKNACCTGEVQVQGLSLRRPNVITLLEKGQAPWTVEPVRRRRGPALNFYIDRTHTLLGAGRQQCGLSCSIELIA